MAKKLASEEYKKPYGTWMLREHQGKGEMCSARYRPFIGLDIIDTMEAQNKLGEELGEDRFYNPEFLKLRASINPDEPIIKAGNFVELKGIIDHLDSLGLDVPHHLETLANLGFKQDRYNLQIWKKTLSNSRTFSVVVTDTDLEKSLWLTYEPAISNGWYNLFLGTVQMSNFNNTRSIPLTWPDHIQNPLDAMAIAIGEIVARREAQGKRIRFPVDAW